MTGVDFHAILDENTSDTLGFVRTLSPGQIHMAGEGEWTPMQIMEHILLVESAIMKRLQSPSEQFHDSDEVMGNSKLKHILVERRDKKVEAIPAMHPRNEIGSIAEFESRFLENREELKELITSGKIMPGNRIYAHPHLGNLTATDWLYFLVHHTRRHLEQIKDRVKA